MNPEEYRDVCQLCDNSELYPHRAQLSGVWEPTSRANAFPKDAILMVCGCFAMVHTYCFDDRVTKFKYLKKGTWNYEIICDRCLKTVPVGVTINGNFSAKDYRILLLGIVAKIALVIGLASFFVTLCIVSDSPYFGWIGFFVILWIDGKWLYFITIEWNPLTYLDIGLFPFHWKPLPLRAYWITVDAVYACLIFAWGMFFMLLFYLGLVIIVDILYILYNCNESLTFSLDTFYVGCTIPVYPLDRFGDVAWSFDLYRTILWYTIIWGPGLYFTYCSFLSAYASLFRKKLLLYYPSWIKIKK